MLEEASYSSSSTPQLVRLAPRWSRDVHDPSMTSILPPRITRTPALRPELVTPAGLPQARAAVESHPLQPEEQHQPLQARQPPLPSHPQTSMPSQQLLWQQAQQQHQSTLPLSQHPPPLPQPDPSVHLGPATARTPCTDSSPCHSAASRPPLPQHSLTAARSAALAAAAPPPPLSSPPPLTSPRSLSQEADSASSTLSRDSGPVFEFMQPSPAVVIIDPGSGQGYVGKSSPEHYAADLRRSLLTARIPSSSVAQLSDEAMVHHVQRQLEREDAGRLSAVVKYRRNLKAAAERGAQGGPGGVTHARSARSYVHQWTADLHEGLVEMRDKAARKEWKLPCKELKTVLTDLDLAHVASAVVGGALRTIVRPSYTNSQLLTSGASALVMVDNVGESVQRLLVQRAVKLQVGEISTQLKAQRRRDKEGAALQAEVTLLAADLPGSTKGGRSPVAPPIASLPEAVVTTEASSAGVSYEAMVLRQRLATAKWQLRELEREGARMRGMEALRNQFPMLSWDAKGRIKVGAALTNLLLERARLRPTQLTPQLGVEAAFLPSSRSLPQASRCDLSQPSSQQLPQHAAAAACEGISKAAAGANLQASERQLKGQPQPQGASAGGTAVGTASDLDGLARPPSEAGPVASGAVWEAAPAAPAFTHSIVAFPSGPQQRKRQGAQGMIQLADCVLEELQGSAQLLHLVKPETAPMVVEPKPWTDLYDGGMLTVARCAFKVDYNDTDHLRAAMQKGELANMLDGLSALGSVPWRIHGRLLEVQLRVRNSGDAALLRKLDLPCELPPLATPPLPFSGTQLRVTPLRIVKHATVSMAATSGPPTFAEAYLTYKVLHAAKRRRSQAFSLLEFATLKQTLASELRHEERIFFPHTADFRGRAYPMHGHLHHQGDDATRALLEFADARPLGPSGWRWLLIHAANLWGQGVDKRSMDARHAFAMEHLEDVKEAAAQPLDGSLWWQSADKPWQLLGTCMDIAAALEHPGGPELYCSHTPVHQDGACNGLQHYSAMARDGPGGASVGLVPMSAPQDVYTTVCKVVDARVREDAAAGHDLALHLLARCGEVNRKMVKQTVMTTVYGVTLMGARDQVLARLADRGLDISDHKTRATAGYIAKLTLDSLGHVFGSARRVMDWLAACATVVAKAHRPMQWTSPLGFPIRQPYYMPSGGQVVTALQQFRVIRGMDPRRDRVDGRKQVAGFPPNYVHSIDASHQFMTAMACREAGLAFASVHDSFWTHAADVDAMNVIIRDKFIELHSYPLLEVLLSELQAAHPDLANQFPAVPPPGDLDLEQVRHSTYFFG